MRFEKSINKNKLKNFKMFKFEQLENALTEMYSVSNSGNVNSELVKKLIGEFFSARNDLVFLHISIKGSNFNELHTLLNEYYDRTDSDIDTLLELYVSVFKKSFNLNEFHFTSDIVKANVFNIKIVLDRILKILERIKSEMSKLGNDAVDSKIDSIAEYYFKQSNFIIPGYLSDIKEDDGSSEGSVGTTSGDIATVDNRFPEIVKRKNRKI